ncbi:MAG TPA: hypothetical protein VMQ81_07855 [Acidimicrobiia bacterium]|nr:hypothetical protein [Acidimicrobiia bacterium]
MHIPRTEIVVTVAVLGLAGIGVAAGAVGHGDDERRPPATEEPDQGDGQAVERYYGSECGEEIPGGTHGDYVSRAAHTDGADVPAVAQSDCGKPLTSVEKSAKPEGERPDHPLGGPPGQTKDKGKPEKS